jgi:hypothetical protein
MSAPDVIARFRRTGTPTRVQLDAAGRVARAWGALARGQVEPAWVHIEHAHDATRNAAALHTHVHLLRAVGFAARGRAGAALRELPLVLNAGPAAIVRRAAGLPPEHPGGTGLRATWKLRRSGP